MPADSPSSASGMQPINDIRSSVPHTGHFETIPPTQIKTSPSLSAAPRPPVSRPVSRSDFGLFLTIIIGICVGAGMLLASPFQYVIGARFVVTGLNPTADLAYYRQALQTYIWQHNSSFTSEDGTQPQWFFESPSATQLTLCRIGRKGLAAVQPIDSVAQAFIKVIHEKLRLAREKPSQQENWLTRQTAALQAQLEQVQGQVELALADIKGDNPLALRDELMTRWKTSKEAFSNDRQAWLRADARLRSLQEEPIPAMGIVTPEQREQAYLANTALQQDLDELRVHLSELKLHLLNVWQKSMPILDELVMAADNFSQTLSTTGSSNGKLPWPALSDMISQYRNTLEKFSSDWRTDFLSIRHRVVDPMNPTLTRLHESLRSRLSGYLFEAGKTLGSARRQVQAIADSSANDARFHVMYSDLVRSFQLLQSLYHRFEFAAGNIESRRNYRLDISLRASRGLHRRSKQRINKIDEHLESRALVQSKKQHVKDIETAKKAVALTRSQIDASIMDLLDLQERLNINIGLSDTFLRASVTVELADEQASSAKQQLTHTQSQQQSLRQQRLEELPESNIKLIECGVIRGPINLRDRLQTALLATFLTILALSVSRWRIRRKS